MEKIVLAAADFRKEKYYLNSEFNSLPEQIKEEIKILSVTLAHKLMCTFLIGFYEDGEVYFEIVKDEEILDFDEIGSELEIIKIQREKRELVESLQLWYKVYKAPNGSDLIEEILNNYKE